MKTRLLLKVKFNYLAYVIVFLFGNLSIYAQCPTVSPSPAICNASGFTFTDLNAFATDQGSGILWYDSATGGTPFNSNQLVEEGTYYAGDTTGTCGTRASIVVDFTVDSTGGANLDDIFCTSENPTIQTYIDGALAPNIPAGGNVLIFTDESLTLQANASDPINLGASNYFIVFEDSAGCRSQIELGSTAVFEAPEDPTPINPQEFCDLDNPTIENLDPGTTENFAWYDDIDSSGNPVPPSLPLTTALVNGNTYYVQVISLFCNSNAVPVTVSVSAGENPGGSADLDFCSNSLPAADFNLFDELGGSPVSTGTWSGPLVTSNGHLGTLNISTLTTPGIYEFIYTTPDRGACLGRNSRITMTIFEEFSAGEPSANNPASFCLSQLTESFNLTTLIIDSDPGGVWTQGTTSSDTVVPSSISLSGFPVGTYNFTYSQNISPNACPEQNTTVQIIISNDPNIGVAINPSPAICENVLDASSSFDLFDALDGTQDNNSGDWTDASGTTVTNPIDISAFTTTNSPYLFTYTIDNSGCKDSVEVSIAIEEAPNAGTVNDNPSFCISAITAGQIIDLFDFLDNEDTPGVWNDDTLSGQLSGSELTLDGLAAGQYSFTYDVDAIGGCDDPNTPTVTINIIDVSSPTATTPQGFCDAGTVGDLVVSGTGIQWYDVLSGGVALDPTTVLVDGQSYYASQTASGCESTVRTEVVANVIALPNSGEPILPALTACSDGEVDLNAALDGTQDLGGTWYEGPDNTGTVIVNPTAYDLTGFPVGDIEFTYEVTASGCPDASTTITITIEEPINAGTNGTLSVCNFNDGSTFDLFLVLGGTPVSGGTWVPELTSTTGIFDPTLDAAGTYNYVLTNSCGNSTSEVVVTVTNVPNAGMNGEVIICRSDIDPANSLLDLVSVLGGTPDTSGTFTNDDGAVGFSGTDLDLSLVALGTYNFTYTVVGVDDCSTNPDVIAVATVRVNDPTAVSVVDATPEFCLSDNPTVLDLEASVSAGSILWYAEEADTTPLDISEALIDGEDYFAVQVDTNNCESSVRAEITVTVNDGPVPTLINPDLELCINDQPTIETLLENVDEYDAASNNVIWYDAESGGNIITASTVLEIGQTYYGVLIDSTFSCPSNVRLEFTPNLTACGDLTLPDGFSPNGDGVNDTYNVNNLELLYPNFNIEIYNRYGNVVYKGDPTTPSFDGKTNQSRALGSGDLPVGVYFYVFKFNDGINEPRQGRLYLNR